MTHGESLKEEGEGEKEGFREGQLRDYFQSGETRKVSPRKLKTEEWAALGTMRNEQRITKLGRGKGCHTWACRLCTARRAEGVGGSWACLRKRGPFLICTQVPPGPPRA